MSVLPYATSYQELLQCQRAQEDDVPPEWQRIPWALDSGVRVYVSSSTAGRLHYVIAIDPTTAETLLASSAYRTVRLHPSLPLLRVHGGIYALFAEWMPHVISWASAAPAPEIRVSGYGVAGALALLFGLSMHQIHRTSVLRVFSFGAPMVGYPEIAQAISLAPRLEVYRFLLPHDATVLRPGSPFVHASIGYVLNEAGVYDPTLSPVPDPGSDASLAAYRSRLAISRTLGDTGGQTPAQTDAAFRSLFVHADHLSVPGTGAVGIHCIEPEYDLDVDGDLQVRGRLVQDDCVVLDHLHLSNVAVLEARDICVATGGTIQIAGNVVLDDARRLSNVATLMAGPLGGRFLVSANGFVGVRANANPRDALDVFGTARVQDGLRVREHLLVDGGGNVFPRRLQVTEGGVQAGVLAVHADTGYVGVGTVTPVVPLHLVGSGRVEGNVTVVGDLQVQGALTFVSTEVQDAQLLRITSHGEGPAAVINQTGAEPVFELQDDGTPVVLVADGGYVGIGTTTPQHRLDLHQGSFGINGTLVLDTHRALSNVASLGLANRAALLTPLSDVTGGLRLVVGADHPISALEIEGASGAVSALQDVTAHGSVHLWGPLSVGGSLFVDAQRALSNLTSLAVDTTQILDAQRALSNITHIALDGGQVQLSAEGTLSGLSRLDLAREADVWHDEALVLDAGRHVSNLSSIALSGGTVALSATEARLPGTTVAGNIVVTAPGQIEVGPSLVLPSDGAARMASLTVGSQLVVDAQRNLRNLASLTVGGSLLVDAQRAVSNIHSLSVGGTLLLDGDRRLGNLTTLSMGSQIVLDAQRNLGNVARLEMAGPLSVGGTPVLSTARGVSNLTSLALVAGASITMGAQTLVDGLQQLRVAKMTVTSTGGKKVDCGNDLTTQRHIVLHQDPAQDNEHEFYGLGVASNTLRFQVPSTAAAHRFYAASAANASTELASISGAGVLTTLSHIHSTGGGLQIAGATVVASDRSLQNIASVNCQAITLRAGGTYGPGSIFSNASYGMLLRARVADPTVADFAVANFDDTKAFTLRANQATLAGALSLPGALVVGSGGITVDQGANAAATAFEVRESTHATSRRAAVGLGAEWSLVQDAAGTGTRDFAIVQTSAATSRLGIHPSTGRVLMPMGIEVGAALVLDAARNLQNVQSLEIAGKRLCGSERALSNVVSLQTEGAARSSAEDASFPSAPLSASTTTLSGTLLSGVHTVSSSSTSASGNPAYQAFDQNPATYFESGQFYNGASGLYAGTKTTTDRATGALYSGEWLQVELPAPLVPTSFALMARQTSPWHLRRAPRNFAFFGSDDGAASWVLLASQTNVTSWTTTGVPLTFSVSAAGRAFRTYRLVVSALGTDGETTSKDYLNVAECSITGSPFGRLTVAADGSTGINTPTPQAALHVEGSTVLAGVATVGALCVGPGGSMVVDRERNLSNVAAANVAGPVAVGNTLFVDAARNLQNVASLSVVGSAVVKGAVQLGPGLAAGASATGLQGGAYVRQTTWDAPAATHTISSTQYSPGNHASGFLQIHATNKNASTPKVGNLWISFLRPGAGSVIVSTVHTHKNDGLTTLTAAASGTDIVVYTDADCSIVWSVSGGF